MTLKTTSIKPKSRASKLPNLPVSPLSIRTAPTNSFQSRKSTGVRKRKAAASRTPVQHYQRQEIKFMLEEMSKMTRWQELGELMNETFKTKRRYGNIKEHFKTIVSARALEGYPEPVE